MGIIFELIMTAEKDRLPGIFLIRISPGTGLDYEMMVKVVKMAPGNCCLQRTLN
jgi:hypothetical protein